MPLDSLFPHLAGWQIDDVTVADDIALELTSTRRTAAYPACGRESRRVHGRYVDPHGVAKAVGFATPAMLQQCFAAADLGWATQQVLQQGKLFGSQVQAPPGHAGEVGGRVQPQAARRQRRGLVGLLAAQEGPQTGGQFGKVEGLGKVVVGALVQARDALVGSDPGGQHQDEQAGLAAP